MKVIIRRLAISVAVIAVWLIDSETAQAVPVVSCTTAAVVTTGTVPDPMLEPATLFLMVLALLALGFTRRGVLVKR